MQTVGHILTEYW